MAPALPIALRILRAVVDRLKTIVAGDDFHTSAGSDVSVGWLSQDPATLALSVHGLEERVTPDRVKSRVTASINVVVTARVPLPTTNTDGQLLEQVIADIQKAVENEDDRTLGGLAQLGITYQGRATAGPPKGSPVSWAWLTYQVGYHRTYGDPATRA